jgi:hypothetical protein
MRRASALMGCSLLALLGATTAVAKPDVVHITGKMRTDGVLTVRQQETVELRGLPPRLNLNLWIAPPDNQCLSAMFMPGTCLPTPLYPAAGTPAFRTSVKGRATLTFVMPESVRFLDITATPEPRVEELALGNGQAIYIRARGLRSQRRDGTRTIVRAKATGRGSVEVPPSP